MSKTLLEQANEKSFVQIGEYFPIKGVWFKVREFGKLLPNAPVPTYVMLVPHGLTMGGLKRAQAAYLESLKPVPRKGFRAQVRRKKKNEDSS